MPKTWREWNGRPTGTGPEKNHFDQEKLNSGSFRIYKVLLYVCGFLFPDVCIAVPLTLVYKCVLQIVHLSMLFFLYAFLSGTIDIPFIKLLVVLLCVFVPRYMHWSPWTILRQIQSSSTSTNVRCKGLSTLEGVAVFFRYLKKQAAGHP